MQLAELAAGLDPKLVDERPPRALIGVERLGLTAAAVEREHQLAAHPLAQRLLCHERLELAGHLGVPAGTEILLDALLEAGEPEVVEAGELRPGEAPVGELGERRATPEGKRLAGPAACLQIAEPREIELVWFDGKQVAGRTRPQPLLADQLPEARDVHLQGLLRRVRRVVLPERVDQPVTGDDGVRVEEQRGQQRTLLGTAEVERLPVGDDLQRTEDPELQCATPRRR